MGQNGQERDVELGAGMYTAEYWEYDARIGRRWNMDPVTNSAISPYSCFYDNPVYFSDPKGDIPPLVYLGLLIGGTMLDAFTQITIYQGLNPKASFEEAFNKVDWADAIVTGVVTASSAGTASELTLSQSVYRTTTRVLAEKMVSGEILKATVDLKRDPSEKDNLKVVLVNKDGVDVVLDFTMGSFGNKTMSNLVDGFEDATKKDLSEMISKNSYKALDVAAQKEIVRVAESDGIKYGAEKIISTSYALLNEALKNKLSNSSSNTTTNQEADLNQEQNSGGIGVKFPTELKNYINYIPSVGSSYLYSKKLARRDKTEVKKIPKPTSKDG